MPTPVVDLDTYFERIGYAHDRAPTLETLQRLHALHTETIAFENLSPFLGEGVKLDVSSLQDKLVRRGRGGYCFEHNLLFWHVLKELGFPVRGLVARVRWNAPSHVVTARSRMLLLVNLKSDRYIADVGFGGLTLSAPMRLEPDVEQATPHEPFRLICSADTYTLEAKLAGVWRALYSFDLQEQHLPDFEVTNLVSLQSSSVPLCDGLDRGATHIGSPARSRQQYVFHLSPGWRDGKTDPNQC